MKLKDDYFQQLMHNILRKDPVILGPAHGKSTTFYHPPTSQLCRRCMRSLRT